MSETTIGRITDLGSAKHPDFRTHLNSRVSTTPSPESIAAGLRLQQTQRDKAGEAFDLLRRIVAAGSDQDLLSLLVEEATELIGGVR